MNTKPIWISDAEVAAVLTPELAYQGVAAALAAHANRLCVQPLKPYVRPGGREREYDLGRHIAMPCYVGGDVNAVGLKWISSVPKNLERGLPRASGIVVLNDVQTGRPLAVMECATLSARRTGAVGALCWNYFGLPGKTVSLIGCGPVNREVALALNALHRPIAEFRIFDVNQARAEAFYIEISRQSTIPLISAPSLETCVRGASAVIAAVTGSKNYIDPAWLQSCRLMLPLSLDDFRAETLLGADKIVVDEFDGCAREEKLFHKLVREGHLNRDQIYAELGQVVTGSKPARIADEKVFANLMGMAVEDIAVAKLVYQTIASN